MQIPMLSVRSLLPKATVRRAAVVVHVRKFLDDRGQETLVDVARGEVALQVVGGLVGVVEFELEGLGDLIIYRYEAR